MTIFGNQPDQKRAGGADGDIGCGRPSAPAEGKVIYLHPMRCAWCRMVISCTRGALERWGRECPHCGRPTLRRIWGVQ